MYAGVHVHVRVCACIHVRTNLGAGIGRDLRAEAHWLIARDGLHGRHGPALLVPTVTVPVVYFGPVVQVVDTHFLVWDMDRAGIWIGPGYG